ncbi:MAG: Sulfatase-like hydrolase/transferase [Acidobacteriota bacterium]|nr:Sulfatase-like hydrolase/transferase [Acidobacteriota bacterium]
MSDWSLTMFRKYPVFPALPFITLLVLLNLLVACSKKPEPYNIILITMDTTRSDYVDSGNGAKAFTPSLKQFSKQAVVFERAYATIPQTLPSHLSILTSYFPHECGVYSNEFHYDNRHKMLQEILKEKGYSTAAVISLGTLASTTGINKGFDLFVENLNGQTVFFTPAEQVTSEGLRLLNKIKKDKFFLFLHYSDPHSPYAPPSTGALGRFYIEMDGKRVTEFNPYQGAILRQELEIPDGTHTIRFKIEGRPEDFDNFVLRKLTPSKNCTLSFQNISFSKNYYGGSHMLKPPEGIITVKSRGKGYVKIFQVIPLLTWRAVLNYYRLEVEYMDQQIGKFLQSLEKEKLLDHTIVVIAADHGEGLGERERYFGHVRYLNQQFIHTPLMMYFPGTAPKRVTEPVSLIGISPSLLEFLGFRDNGFRIEESLLQTIRDTGKTDLVNRDIKPVFSFAFSPSSIDDRFSVIQWPYQCIFNKDSSGVVTQETYQLLLSQSFRKWDEFSTDVLVRHSRKDYIAMQQAFHQVSGVFTKNKLYRAKTMNREELEKLKTMGYIQ